MNCPSCRQALNEDAQFCSNCGASTALANATTQIFDPQKTVRYSHPQDPLVGRVLDSKYELLQRLGEGGMGAVYRARRLHIGDEVAVKLLHPDMVLEAQAIERFRREARSAAMISHPNVVSIHDFSDATGPGTTAYIVMELVKGASLRQLLEREGRMSAERAVALMRDICAGVGVAHRQGLLHRDLKPDNVIITPASHEGERETAKVVDFGLAKLRDVTPGAALTQTGAVMGTLYYMSPEQCRGEELDARADVYSLGAMLFEMLTGGPPFQSSSLAGLITKHLHEPPPPFPESLQIPPSLAAACFRALSKDREQRQPEARAFSRELQAALTAPTSNPLFAAPSQTLQALPAPAAVPVQRQTSGWLKWTILAGGALLLLVAVVGIGIAIKYGVAGIAGRNGDKSNNSDKRNVGIPSNTPGTVPTVQTDATPSAQSENAAAATDLKGTWTGTYGPLGQPATLIIKTQKGDKFDGVLEQGAIRVAFNGTFDPAPRVVKMKQSEVLSGGTGSWSLGEDVGQVDANGKKMSGTGKDELGGALGIPYQWSFTRR
jgi:serine/threonine-protein kinase